MASTSSTTSSSSCIFTNNHNFIDKSQLREISISNINPSSISRSRSPAATTTTSSVCWCWWCCCSWSSSSSSPSSSISLSRTRSIIFLLAAAATISLLSFPAPSTAARTSPLLITPAPAPSPSPPIYTTLIFTGQQQQQQLGQGNNNKSTTNNNNTTSSSHHHHHHRNLIIALTVSSLFLITCSLLIIMACCFNFFRFNNRKVSQRVLDQNDIAQDHHQSAGGAGGGGGFPANKIQFPDRPLLVPSSASSCFDIDDDDQQHYKNKFDNPCFSMPVKKFSWDEIQRLTMNFSTRVIGEGGFSTVYLSHFSDSSLGALKIHSNSERLNRIFKQELDVLLQIRHDNIVQFLGYCDERDEGALVFEFVSNGSLHEKLHCTVGGDDCVVVLPWNRRMRIAFQLAQAIEYLHDKCTHQIIHGDIKSSNVLLDEELNCKLCDFGFSKMGFSSTVMPSSLSPLMGSPGYMDPNYLRTGIASKKNDVYSFGVIILELITGIEAFCSDRQKLLTTIAAPILGISKDSAPSAAAATVIAEMMDPRLDGNFDAEEAIAMASISSMCLQQQPGMRPSMSEILRIMKDKIPSVDDAYCSLAGMKVAAPAAGR